MHAKYLRIFLGGLFLIFAAHATMAWAAESEMEAGVATFWALLGYGWQINLILGLLAFLSLFLCFHVLLITRKGLTVPSDLYQAVLDDIASGDIEQACSRAEQSRSVMGSVVLPALKLHDHPVERLHQVSEGAGRRAVSALRQKATYLSNIGVLCPMIGLLGTVFGMMTAFESFGAELDVSLKQKMLTGAIGKAMITTAVGLMVGIPSMAAYYLCIGRVNRIADELELAAENVIASLKETK